MCYPQSSTISGHQLSVNQWWPTLNLKLWHTFDHKAMGDKELPLELITRMAETPQMRVRATFSLGHFSFSPVAFLEQRTTTASVTGYTCSQTLATVMILNSLMIVFLSPNESHNSTGWPTYVQSLFLSLHCSILTVTVSQQMTHVGCAQRTLFCVLQA